MNYHIELNNIGLDLPLYKDIRINLNAKRVYLISSLKNYGLNQLICKIIEDKGVSCFLPQRDSLEINLKISKNENNNNIALNIQKANVNGIKNADIILAIAQNLGTDSAWECGFAKGINKSIILLRRPQDPIEDVYMLFNTVDHIISIPKYEEFKFDDSIFQKDTFKFLQKDTILI